jgi:hypothetical protein
MKGKKQNNKNGPELVYREFPRWFNIIDILE